MLSYFSLLVCTCAFLGFSTTVNAGPWASPAQEELDELHDIEIYKAIVTSMKQWQKHQDEKKLHRREKRQQSNVCYKDLGCFEASGPFGYLDMLPSPPEEIGTKFLLYPGHRSRRSGFSHAEVPFSNLTYAFKWAQQGFNKSLPTKILIHGFGSDCSHIWVYELRSALMAVEEMNIICVDWATGAELPNYVKAATNTRLVGKQLSVLLRGLMDHSGLSSQNLHLIGFSLGAHVAGFAGAELGNLSRITGLDPAGPLFESQDPRARLDQTDAEFVDVIHSNGENIILGGLGSWQPLGHVDFYPNGGRMQKGCTNIFVGAVSDIIWSSAVEGRSLCNHRRAYKFFTDSVSPRCHFPAFPCETYEGFLEGRCFPCTDERGCGNMGYYADRSKGRGQLFLITRDEEPFCAHQYHVKIESSTSDIPITSYGRIQITLVGDSALNETFIMTRKDDEEMKLGHSISRILVPHPVLAEPTKIQILYTAYSGWLSSGLTHWKIDKITLSDSFGKSSSICKKDLVLQSGTPITLPLYPGQCNLPPNDSKPAQDRVFDQQPKNISSNSDVNKSEISKFVPTPVVRIGNEAIGEGYTGKDKAPLRDAAELFNLPWHHLDKDNRLDDEKETSRALNTRVVKTPEVSFEKAFHDTTETFREVVEPILKPHSSKNARSHDPDKDKLEISEPILGPTTAKVVFTPNVHGLGGKANNKKEIRYNFYDSNEDGWVPSVTQKNERRTGEKWKRHDDSKPVTDFEQHTEKPENENDAFNFISMTVQFLPQRLARMFEQAEKYARETILPFVSAHTPKIIRNFIAPEEKTKYLPLHYEENTKIYQSGALSVDHQDGGLKNRRFDPPPKFQDELSRSEEGSTTTTPYTHIQKITKRGETFSIVLPETTTIVLHSEDNEMVSTENQEVHKKIGLDARPKSFSDESPRLTTISEQNNTKGIYIDLPVFEDNYKDLKYIPLTDIENEKSKKI